MEPVCPLINIPFPVSVNAMYRAYARGNRVAKIKTKTYRDWRKGAVAAISEQWGQRAIIDRPVKLDVAIRPPDRRRRDIDNLNKSILDALEGIVLKNDNLVHDIRTYWDFSEGKPQASILIQPLPQGVAG